MAPVRKGDGTPLAPTDYQQVRKGDGTVLFDAIPDSGVSRWRFEQDVTDLWGDNDGSIEGNPQFVTDAQVGTYALDFDGVDDAVNFGQITELEGVSELSLSMWIKINSFSNNPRALGYDTESNGRLGFQVVSFDSANNISFQVNDSGAGTATLNTGQWYHVVGTYSDPDLSIYLDGSDVGTDTGSETTNAGNTFYAAFSDREGSYQEMILDDPRAYNKELSATEVSNLYNTGNISG